MHSGSSLTPENPAFSISIGIAALIIEGRPLFDDEYGIESKDDFHSRHFDRNTLTKNYRLHRDSTKGLSDDKTIDFYSTNQFIQKLPEFKSTSLDKTDTPTASSAFVSKTDSVQHLERLRQKLNQLRSLPSTSRDFSEQSITVNYYSLYFPFSIHISHEITVIKILGYFFPHRYPSNHLHQQQRFVIKILITMKNWKAFIDLAHRLFHQLVKRNPLNQLHCIILVSAFTIQFLFFYFIFTHRTYNGFMVFYLLFLATPTTSLQRTPRSLNEHNGLLQTVTSWTGNEFSAGKFSTPSTSTCTSAEFQTANSICASLSLLPMTSSQSIKRDKRNGKILGPHCKQFLGYYYYCVLLYYSIE